MQRTSRLRTSSIGLMVAALAATTVAVGGSQLSAQEEGPAGHFVVLGRPGTLSGTLESIAEAGGQVLVSYPQIGVVVVTSTDADFAVERPRNSITCRAGGSTRALVEFIPPSAPRSMSSAKRTGRGHRADHRQARARRPARP